MPVIQPSDERCLAEVLRLASAEKIPVMISGGGTCPSPVCIDETVRVSLARLAEVREVSAGDFLVVAQAGAVADSAVAAAERERLLLPLDITSGARATVGGAYMTAAVGPYAAGYGPFRDYILGARCIGSSGEIVTFGGRTMKNVTGYEIARFLAGTMGLFAVAVELTLKALPMPERRVVLAGRFGPESDPFDTASGVGSAGGSVKFVELVAENGLGGEILVGVGIEGRERTVARGAAAVRAALERAGALSVDEERPEEFSRRRRDASERHARPGLVTATVSPSASAALLREFRRAIPNTPVLAHPLLGRIHADAGGTDIVAVIRSRTLAVGGKIPTTWGQAIREGLTGMFTPEELAVARALKRELDPAGVLNPHLKTG